MNDATKPQEMEVAYAAFFADGAVKPEFRKRFVSLWPGWLGPERLHELDTVNEIQWSKFNGFVRALAQNYQFYAADVAEHTLERVDDIEATLSSLAESMEKSSGEFSRYVLPELCYVLTEDWDYTFVLLHRDDGAVEALAPMVARAGLFIHCGHCLSCLSRSLPCIGSVES